MLRNLAFRTRNEGVEMGQKLVEEGYIEHVCDTQPFKDAYLFFRFTVRSPATNPNSVSTNRCTAINTGTSHTQERWRGG